MPSELLPAATRPVASGRIGTPAHGAAAAGVVSVPVAGVPLAGVLGAAGVPIAGALAPLSSGALVGTAVSEPVAALLVLGAGLEALGAPAAFVPPGAVPNAAIMAGADAVPASFDEHAASAQLRETEDTSERARDRMRRL